MKNKKWTDEQLVEAVENNESMAGVLRNLGLRSTGSNYAILKLKIKQLNLDKSHFTGQAWCKGDRHKDFINRFVRIDLKYILVKDSTYLCTHTLKKRLICDNLLQNICYICNSLPEWNGKPLSLQLDHIDGDRTNNTIENLRILCPNCHSQTPTFSGKSNNGKKLRISCETNFKCCLDCNKKISHRALRCKSCQGKLKLGKIDWPDLETLERLVGETSFREVGRKLGVSDTAIRKRIKNKS